MKHFPTIWERIRGPVQVVDAVIDGFARMGRSPSPVNPRAISYELKPDFVRSFANAGYPFLTFYEFGDLAGFCRDTYFAPDHVPGYSEEVGKSYTVWTHETYGAYRRHIMLDDLTRSVRISFEVPRLDAASWFPLRISVHDRNGLYFQTDQKLVVDRIDARGMALSSWKKIPQLGEALRRLHHETRAAV